MTFLPFDRRLIAGALLFAPIALTHALAHAVPADAPAMPDAAAIARIEAGLRPSVALDGKPVPTRTLAGEMARLHVPGVSVALIRDGKIAWAKGYGATVAGGAPVTPDTLFQAASISKPVSAAGALHLVAQGRLDLDADIDTELAGWKLPPGPQDSHATLRQLLSHTAGTTVSGFPGYAGGTPVPSVTQVLDGASPANTPAVRIDTPPGTIWRYSGGGYTVVQQAIVDRGGRPFADQLADTVLAPFGMRRSTFAQPLPQTMIRQAAQPHDADGKPYPGGPYVYPELAAAGLWTTPSDLARFAIGLRDAAAGRRPDVMPAALAKTMLTPVKNGYGLGVEIEGKGPSLSFGHGGSNRGYQNTLYAFVEHGDGAVVMTNGDGGDEIGHALLRAIAFEYGWPGAQTTLRRAVALAPAQRRALVGRYGIEGLGTFEITEQAGQLMFSKREGMAEPLYAASPTVFFVLSSELELRLARAGASSGRLLSGPYDVKFMRVPR